MSAMPKPNFTVREYLDREDELDFRSEYYRGEVFPIQAASRWHAVINNNLIVQMSTGLKGQPCQVMSNEIRVKVESDDFYSYPDCLVVCGEQIYESGRTDTLLNPVLLVEIASPSTFRHDRIFKLRLYKRIPSLRHYLLVEQDEARVEIYSRLEDGEWKHNEYTGLVDTLPLTAVGLSVPMEEIYRNIEFPKPT